MIRVEALTKQFRIYHKPSDRLMEALLRRRRHRTHTALDRVSFTVAPGEALGVLGRNGAGKSTLLRILAGILQADSGRVRIDGRLTGLLELGTGFDYDLSGEQNIVTNGLLLGMSHAEIRARRDAMIRFSELGEFIREPLRIYSTGMVMRLAFSIAIHADPACLVVDEALSVGDAHFQQKCLRRIREFRRRGGALVFVSHDLGAVKMLCDRALVLERGGIDFSGSPEAAVNHYNRLLAAADDRRALESPAGDRRMFGNGLAEITGVEVAGLDSGSRVVSAGEQTRIRLYCTARETLADMTAGFVIRDRFGQDIFGVNSFHLGASLPLAAGESACLEFAFPMEIAPGRYTLTAALHGRDNHLENCYCWCDNIADFEVAGVRGPQFSGLCRMPVVFSKRGNPSV